MNPLFIGIVLFASFTHGFSGLGFGIIIMACLFISPWTAEVTAFYTNVLVIFVFLVILLADRKTFQANWLMIRRIFIGQALGIIAGYQFIHYYGQRGIFYFSLGLILVIFSGYQLLRSPIKRHLPTWVGLAAGLFAGFCTGAFAAGGPPIALYMYSSMDNPVEAKWTMQIIFLFGLIWRFFNVAFFSNIITPALLTSIAAVLPAVLACTILGHLVSRYLSPKKFAIIVNVFIAMSGLTNIVMALT